MNKVRFEMQFDPMTDKDIIAKLESLPKLGKADYIRNLIKTDIRREKRRKKSI